jgi:UDP-N-acetylmuramoylalanine--D-glutamate ligase
MEEELETGVYLSKSVKNSETIMYRTADGCLTEILPVSELGIPGRHNVQNALAATAVALTAGAPAAAVARALREFRGVEHRLEFVREKNGVKYVNGSKATNPAATIKDLEAFSRPIVLIAGGLDRGMEYDILLPYFKERLSAIITLGETRDKLNLVAEQAGVPTVRTVSKTEPAEAMREAVALAERLAKPDDIVLLSPACASWDMYASYEQRGSMFKESVHTL